MMRLNSIRARMTVGFTFSIAALMLLVCNGLALYSRRTAEHSADRLLKAAAAQLQREWLSEERDSEFGEAMENLSDIRGEHLVLLVVDARGRVVLTSQRQVPPWPLRADNGWRTTAVRAGGDTLVVGMPWLRTEQALDRQALTLAVLGLLAVMASTAGAWVMVGRTLSPIGALSMEAQTASVDGLKVRLRAPSHDLEVVGLVTTLNGLLDRIAEAAAMRGRFYAAASHELRTPLQALSGHLELALSRERPAPAYRAAIEEANRQARRLTSLVQDLLLLNQLESATASPKPEPVDMADICERALRHVLAIVEQRHLKVQTVYGPVGEVYVPGTHAEMLARNLIENAVKYALPGGAVRITVEPVVGGVRLGVRNECEPLRAETVAHLFEPFFRPDASRASATGGNGLGLTICRAIAQANGWPLKLQTDDGQFIVQATLLTGQEDTAPIETVHAASSR